MARKAKPQPADDLEALLAAGSTDLDDFDTARDMDAVDDLDLSEPEESGAEDDRPFAEIAREELKELEEERLKRDAFHRARKAEQATRDDVGDSDFFACIVFQSKKQRDEFLRKVGWQRLLEERQFIDGLLLARHLGVSIEEPTPKPLRHRSNRKLLELAENGPLSKSTPRK